LSKGLISDSEKEPEIGPFALYVDAFEELSSCRNSGMALGPIPFTAIVEYSKIFDVGDFEDFLFFMRVMDNKVLKLSYDKSKSSMKGNKKNASK
jgi:hypothetical protein